MPRGPLLQFFDRFWWRQAVFAFGAAGLAWLIVATALEKGISDLDRAVVLGIGLAAAIAFAMTSGLLPGKRRKPKQASQDGSGPALMVLFFNVAGVVSTAVGMTSPRPATESQPGVIEWGIAELLRKATGIEATTAATRDDTSAIRRGLEQQGMLGGRDSRIRKRIAGTWGEAGCRVTYAFAITGDSLTVRSLRSEPGMAEYRGAGSIVSEAGDRLITVAKDDNAGQAAEFLYRSDGADEWLTWRDRAADVAQELVRCNQG